MKIHEYQAKEILKKYGVAVPRGMMAATREEAEAAAKDLLGSGATGVVVKAQIHAGGRGKGGGVKIAKSVEETGEIAGKIAFSLGLKPQQINPAVQFLTSLYRAFLETDASLVEINPFISCTDGRLFALDAKLTFDDNALFRHSDLRELRDFSEEDALEVEASKYNLNYIKLDGSVGCMVNGAGLAMATMDIIKYAGGMPANFLDVGGSASADQVAHAF